MYSKFRELSTEWRCWASQNQSIIFSPSYYISNIVPFLSLYFHWFHHFIYFIISLLLSSYSSLFIISPINQLYEIFYSPVFYLILLSQVFPFQFLIQSTLDPPFFLSISTHFQNFFIFKNFSYFCPIIFFICHTLLLTIPFNLLHSSRSSSFPVNLHIKKYSFLSTTLLMCSLSLSLHFHSLFLVPYITFITHFISFFSPLTNHLLKQLILASTK